MKKNNKANQTFNTILRFILGSYLKLKFRMEANYDEIKDLKSPYIILGNHTNNWDPFLMSIYVKEPIHFVAGEGNFKNPFLSWALINLVGAIPKTKFMPDSATIRQIIKVKNSGGIIGIFPEGQRNWHGVTGELMYSTAKLIKALKIPVVTVKLKGAYLSHPRWAENSRKGKVELHYNLALTPEDVKAMNEDEIFNIISEKIYHNEEEWQKEKKITFKGTNAERLELFLFACPHCSSIEALVSKGNEFKCRTCGYSIHYNQYGNINTNCSIMHFDNLFEWDKWQLEFLHKNMDNLSVDDAIFQSNQVTVYEGKKMKNFSSKFAGFLLLYRGRLLFKTVDGQKKDFIISDIDGVNVNQNKRIEFFYNRTMYRIAFDNKRTSAYMWVSAIEYLKKSYKNTLEGAQITLGRKIEVT